MPLNAADSYLFAMHAIVGILAAKACTTIRTALCGTQLRQLLHPYRETPTTELLHENAWYFDPE